MKLVKKFYALSSLLPQNYQAKFDMKKFLRSTLNPAMYHGHAQSPPFFEGWYFKMVSDDERQRWAIIPGIFLGENGHAFIQVLNGNRAQSRYFRYSLSEFWASRDEFDIKIGQNQFSSRQISLDIDDSHGNISGTVQFEGTTPWPVSLISPGIMGWYAWVPRMECYHGVLSLDHSLRGTLQIDGEAVDFTNGRGYIEKDWGQTFPQAYIWFQGNHFATKGTSVTASVAIIPWLGNAFRGFIIGFWHQGVLHRFATYNNAKIEALSVDDEHVYWRVRNHSHQLEMIATRTEGGLLHEPTRSNMLQRVEETMTAVLEVRLLDVKGNEIFQQKSRNAALEVQGDLSRLLKMK
jgi:tocopherol cyclase